MLAKALVQAHSHLDRLSGRAIEQIEAANWDGCSEIWGKLIREFSQQVEFDEIHLLPRLERHCAPPEADLARIRSENDRLLGQLEDMDLSIQLRAVRASSIRSVVQAIRAQAADKQRVFGCCSATGAARTAH